MNKQIMTKEQIFLARLNVTRDSLAFIWFAIVTYLWKNTLYNLIVFSKESYLLHVFFNQYDIPKSIASPS